MHMLSSTQRCIRCKQPTHRPTAQHYCAYCNDLWLRDRISARAWACAHLRRWATHRDWVILDTETTGLQATAQVVELTLLAPDSTVLVDSLVRPTNPIPPDATQIHHITDQMVATAPTFADLYPTIARYLHNCTVVVYNAAYDRGVIDYELQHYHLPRLQNTPWACAMQWYAKFAGVWNPSYGNYRWHKLESGDHTALGDCRATLSLIQQMAA